MQLELQVQVVKCRMSAGRKVMMPEVSMDKAKIECPF